MRAVYTEFFSHYSEERLNTLLSEAIAEAMSEEEAEGERSVGADLLSYEELIKEVVPGFTYVSFMQRVMNQIGHQFTFLRVSFFFIFWNVSHVTLESATNGHFSLSSSFSCHH